MNIEKLIERLYKHHTDCGEGRTQDFFEVCLDCKDAATALSTLQAENAQLRGELEYEQEHANAYHEECGQWEAENEKLRAELKKMKRERDAAIKDIWVSKWTSCKYGKDCTFTSARTGFPDCAGCGDWEWRGIKED